LQCCSEKIVAIDVDDAKMRRLAAHSGDAEEKEEGLGTNGEKSFGSVLQKRTACCWEVGGLLGVQASLIPLFSMTGAKLVMFSLL
jgi:hypothetical protein